ncbi:MAG: hybrid sensor histidine kinase/response regulator [Syntrophales bacterium]
MKATTTRFKKEFSAIFQWRSLKTKVTLLTLAVFLIGIWSLTFYASRMLREDMQRMLSEQQFSTASIIAADINGELEGRFTTLEKVAGKITPAMLGNPAAIQKFLEDRIAYPMLFNAGTYATRLDGIAIADIPLAAGRVGVNYSDRDYLLEALKGKTTISKPLVSKRAQAPAVVMSTPIRDAKGRVIGALAGRIRLSESSFLDKIAKSRYGKTGAYMLVAPQHNLIITGTDKSRIMQKIPTAGVNPLWDSYARGFEGSGVIVDSRGLEVLSSAKQIPTAGWIIVARIPTKEAFAPIRAMQNRMLLAAIFLSLLAGILTWWMLKRQLAPIFTTIKTLAVLADADQPPEPLPIARKDEIGELIGGFNQLLEALRKRREDLKQSEERFALFMDHSPALAFIKDNEGRTLYVNKSMDKAFNASTWIGLNTSEIFNSSEAARILADDQRAMQMGYQKTEESFLNLDGKVHHYETQKFLISRADQQPLLGGIAVDVTDRKQAEEERNNLEERLQRAEKMEALGLLAGGVAHDLNNVLGIVVGYAELILESADASSSLKPHLLNIMNGGQKAAAIVNDLLTLARRGVSGRDIINLNKIIADFCQSPEFEKLSSYHTAVEIKAELEPDLPNITCSSVHLGKSLYNLVANGCEAMAQGGILTIRTASQYLDMPLQGYDEIQSGDYVVLSVADTGEGIDNKDLKRIFEPFYTKKVMGRSGTGLGLAVVWGTVKDHHGYINVQSEKGKGSVFTLYLPATKQDRTTEGEAVALAAYMGKGESILVVDDVKEQRELAAGMLSSLNYQVFTAAGGAEAVAYLQERTVDLLVLDMIMDSGMDGLDTYKSVLAIHPRQKAIIVSGFSESDRVHEAQGLGAGTYVRKPYIKEKLGLAVRKELERSAQ